VVGDVVDDLAISPRRSGRLDTPKAVIMIDSAHDFGKDVRPGLKLPPEMVASPTGTCPPIRAVRGLV
jgi:hypothetical protein